MHLVQVLLVVLLLVLLVLVPVPVLVLVPVLVSALVPVLVLVLVLVLVPPLLFRASTAAPPGPPSWLRGQFALLHTAHELGFISLSHKSIVSCLEEPISRGALLPQTLLEQA